MRDKHIQENIVENEKLAQNFDHPNILKIYESGTADGVAYIIMDYIQAGSLSERMKNWYWHPKLREIISIFMQVAAGLKYLHDKGVVHRDIKPGNILLDEKNHVLISDFGLSTIIEQAYDENIVIGTPSYISPETIKYPNKVDSKADIYSLGIVIYELISGKSAFPGTSAQSILRSQIQYAPPKLDEIADVPSQISSLINKCLSKNPTDRPSAIELIEQLEALSAKLSNDELDSRAHGYSTPPEMRPGIQLADAHDTIALSRDESRNVTTGGLSNDRPTEVFIRSGSSFYSKQNNAELYLVNNDNSAIPPIISIPEQGISIGRSVVFANIVIPDRRVSRLHCRIVQEDRKFKILDEGSVCGTYVNAERVNLSGQILRSGDIISIGPADYRFINFTEVTSNSLRKGNNRNLDPFEETHRRRHLREVISEFESDTTKLIYAEELSPGAPIAMFIVKSGADIGKVLPVYYRSRAVFGRSLFCNFTLSDPTVSSFHALLIHTSGNSNGNPGFMLIDLTSSNGTLVNEDKIAQQYLHHNDLIKMGLVELTFKRLDD